MLCHLVGVVVGSKVGNVVGIYVRGVVGVDVVMYCTKGTCR